MAVVVVGGEGAADVTACRMQAPPRQYCLVEAIEGREGGAGRQGRGGAGQGRAGQGRTGAPGSSVGFEGTRLGREGLAGRGGWGEWAVAIATSRRGGGGGLAAFFPRSVRGEVFLWHCGVGRSLPPAVAGAGEGRGRRGGLISRRQENCILVCASFACCALLPTLLSSPA